jgi:hypothetical protein
VSEERVLSGSEPGDRVQGVLVGGDDGLRSRVGVLVLAGSSGRVDVVRARSFAVWGLLRWRSGGLGVLGRRAGSVRFRLRSLFVGWICSSMRALLGWLL